MLNARQGGISAESRKELGRALAGGRRTVTPAQVAASLGIDAVTAAKKLARWAEQGWMRRVRRGLYIPVPVDAFNAHSWSEDPLVLGAAVWSPCYFTGWTGANHWGLTEQIFQTTVLKTTQRVRRSTERLMGHEYLLRHVSSDHLEWGLSSVWVSEQRIMMADPARTVVDALDDPKLIGGIRHLRDVLSTYWAEHDSADLLTYGDRLGNGAVFKRLGYLTSRAGVDDPELIEGCRQRLSTGIALLDPSAPGPGVLVPEWGLRANVAIGPGEAS